MNNVLKEFLENLGFSPEEIVIFSTLSQKGPNTVLNLSRLTGINRTRLYRLIERLKKQRLVEELIDENRVIIKAAEIHQLELLIKEQENRTQFLKKNLSQIADFLSLSQSTIQPGTKVLFYRGVEGIKQMVWNTLQAKKEVIGYTYLFIDEFVGNRFIDDWRNEFANRHLYFRDIISDDHLKSLSKLGKKPTFKGSNSETRYLPNKILNINHQVDIYNDVFSIYNWHEGEVFGVEIYNNKVAMMQKQLFEIVWKIAKKSLAKEE